MLKGELVDIKARKHLVIALKDLDGVPSLLLFGQVMDGGLLDMSDRVLNAAGEAVLRDRLTALCSLYSSLGGFLNTGLL